MNEWTRILFFRRKPWWNSLWLITPNCLKSTLNLKMVQSPNMSSWMVFEICAMNSSVNLNIKSMDRMSFCNVFVSFIVLVEVFSTCFLHHCPVERPFFLLLIECISSFLFCVNDIFCIIWMVSIFLFSFLLMYLVWAKKVKSEWHTQIKISLKVKVDQWFMNTQTRISSSNTVEFDVQSNSIPKDMGFFPCDRSISDVASDAPLLRQLISDAWKSSCRNSFGHSPSQDDVEQMKLDFSDAEMTWDHLLFLFDLVCFLCSRYEKCSSMSIKSILVSHLQPFIVTARSESTHLCYH